MHTVNLNKYILHLYINNSFDLDLLTNELFINKLNTEEYPRGIVEQLEFVGNLTKIQIYDINHNLMLSSEYLIQ
ncbi:hypothetical protein EBZ38_10980 [bacterium]|nr:hypothetical protein [bacterium]